MDVYSQPKTRKGVFVYQINALPMEVYGLLKELKVTNEMTHRQLAIAAFYLAGLTSQQQPDLWKTVVTRVKEKYPVRTAEEIQAIIQKKRKERAQGQQ